MTGPCRDQFVIQLAGLLHTLRACDIVRQCIGILRATGGCHQVEDRVIAVTQADFIHAQAVQHLCPFRIIHVSTVIQRPAVADDQDPLHRHGPGRFQKDILLHQLQANLSFLVILVGSAGPRRNAS